MNSAFELQEKWVDAKKQVPIHSHDVLVTDGERVSIGDYCNRFGRAQWALQGSVYFEPTHWIDIPQLPIVEQ